MNETRRVTDERLTASTEVENDRYERSYLSDGYAEQMEDNRGGPQRPDEELQARSLNDEIQGETYSKYNLREVNIRPLNSGYLVNVGCQSVSVETTESLLKALGEYLNNPSEFERAWNKNQNRNKLE